MLTYGRNLMDRVAAMNAYHEFVKLVIVVITYQEFMLMSKQVLLYSFSMRKFIQL
jgi:hypothetical protein